MPAPILLRVGLPDATGRLPLFLFEMGRAALISASALWDHDRKEFREPPPALEDLDIALDSAGYVAQSEWNGYPWEISQYVDLAWSASWAWWAQQDFCCEPQIAKDPGEVLYRVERSARWLRLTRERCARWRDQLLDESAREWGSDWDADAEAGARARYSDPVPVLQGWRPDDYAYSAQLVGERVLGGAWPELVGVGSVCRRHLRGEAGLLEVLTRLHHELPPAVRLHLFGVKGAVLLVLQRDYPQIAARVASVDSQAWGTAVRWDVIHERQAVEALLEDALGRPLLPEEQLSPDHPLWIPCDMPRKERALARWLEEQERPGEPSLQQRLFGGA